MDIDPYPISALQDRYGLSSRQAVYDRINALGIKPVARGKISSEQLDILDKLNEHIKAGGAIADFANPKDKLDKHAASREAKPTASFANAAPTPRTELARSPLDLANIPVDKLDNLPELASDSMTLENLTRLVEAIATLTKPEPEPLQHLIWLERAATSGWLLTTADVKNLTGVEPRTRKGERSFNRGSFAFIKSGKIGNQTAWKVLKVHENPDSNSGRYRV